MNNKTREEKIEIIRGAVNDDEYIKLLSDEQIDQLCEAAVKPIKDKVTDIYESVKNIIKSLIENTKGR